MSKIQCTYYFRYVPAELGLTGTHIQTAKSIPVIKIPAASMQNVKIQEQELFANVQEVLQVYNNQSFLDLIVIGDHSRSFADHE